MKIPSVLLHIRYNRPMNGHKSSPIISLLLVLLLTACNFPGMGPEPTATPTLTPTSPPTPTDTPTPLPPTATLPPTPTFQFMLPTLPPTAVGSPLPPPTLPPVFTPTSIVPQAGVRFEGEFDGGIFSFRVNNSSNMVTLKEIILSKAQCKNGKTISDRLQFPVIAFPIENGRFTISVANAYVTGVFTTATTAIGSLSVTVKADKLTCEVGPVSWKAKAGGN